MDRIFREYYLSELQWWGRVGAWVRKNLGLTECVRSYRQKQENRGRGEGRVILNAVKNLFINFR